MDAVTIALWSDVTGPAVATKLAVVVAPGTETVGGTVSAVVTLLATVTLVPPVGAGLERVTVHVVVDDGVKAVLAQLNTETDIGARIVNTWDWLDAPRDAVTVAVCWDVTAPAVAVKLAVVAPAGTATEGGTDSAEGRLLPMAMLTPPLGAAKERVTVQLVVREASRVVAAHCREEMPGDAMMDKVAEAVAPPSDADTVAL